MQELHTYRVPEFRINLIGEEWRRSAWERCATCAVSEVTLGKSPPSANLSHVTSTELVVLSVLFNCGSGGDTSPFTSLTKMEQANSNETLCLAKLNFVASSRTTVHLAESQIIWGDLTTSGTLSRLMVPQPSPVPGRDLVTMVWLQDNPVRLHAQDHPDVSYPLSVISVHCLHLQPCTRSLFSESSKTLLNGPCSHHGLNKVFLIVF